MKKPLRKIYAPPAPPNPHPLLLMYQIGKITDWDQVVGKVVTLMAGFKKASDSIGGNGEAKCKLHYGPKSEKSAI